MAMHTPYVHPVTVRFADTDAEGHVYSGSYFVYCDEALMGLLDAAGWSWEHLADRGVAVYYVEANCQFKHPARFGDQLLVYTTIENIGRTSFRSRMRIVAEDKDALIATGYIASVMVEKAVDKPIAIPDDIKQALARFRCSD